MWGKILFLMILVISLVFASWILYQNIPGEAEELKTILINAGSGRGQEVIEYGEIEQFYPNMRFNHNQISYLIEDSCNEKRKNRMKKAFFELQNRVQLISFYPEIENPGVADILVGCSEDYISKEENSFIAGEGGPTKIINSSLYNVILNGKILLYKESECDFPIVETHELLHVFGFNHINNPKDIMYNLSSCNQEISQETIDMLNSLYKIETLPDLYVSEINATKKGRYLDFEIEVRNQGLTEAENVGLYVSTDGKKIENFSLGDIELGAGKRIWVTSLKLPSRNVKSVKFIIDRENKIKELRRDNNEITLSVAT